MRQDPRTDEDGREWTHVCTRCGIRMRTEVLGPEGSFPVYDRLRFDDCDYQVVASVMES